VLQVLALARSVKVLRTKPRFHPVALTRMVDVAAPPVENANAETPAPKTALLVQRSRALDSGAAQANQSLVNYEVSCFRGGGREGDNGDA